MSSEERVDLSSDAGLGGILDVTLDHVFVCIDICNSHTRKYPISVFSRAMESRSGPSIGRRVQSRYELRQSMFGHPCASDRRCLGPGVHFLNRGRLETVRNQQYSCMHVDHGLLRDLGRRAISALSLMCPESVPLVPPLVLEQSSGLPYKLPSFLLSPPSSSTSRRASRTATTRPSPSTVRTRSNVLLPTHPSSPAASASVEATTRWPVSTAICQLPSRSTSPGRQARTVLDSVDEPSGGSVYLSEIGPARRAEPKRGELPLIDRRGQSG